MTHDSSHEALLEALLTGDARPDAGDVRARLRDCAQCRERWNGLSKLVERMGALGVEQRAVLHDAARPGASPGSDSVSSKLAELRAAANVSAKRADPRVSTTATGSRPSALRDWRVWVAAIAACVMVALAYQRFIVRDAPRTDDIELGSDEIELLSPKGDVKAFDEFRWTSRIEGAEFEL